MRYERDFYFVQYNGETKQECVDILKGFILCGFVELSITNVQV